MAGIMEDLLHITPVLKCPTAILNKRPWPNATYFLLPVPLFVFNSIGAPQGFNVGFCFYKNKLKVYLISHDYIYTYITLWNKGLY